MTTKQHRPVEHYQRNYQIEPIVEVYPDYVIICGQFVRRPSYLSPSQWLAYWERR